MPMGYFDSLPNAARTCTIYCDAIYASLTSTVGDVIGFYQVLTNAQPREVSFTSVHLSWHACVYVVLLSVDHLIRIHFSHAHAHVSPHHSNNSIDSRQLPAHQVHSFNQNAHQCKLTMSIKANAVAAAPATRPHRRKPACGVRARAHCATIRHAHIMIGSPKCSGAPEPEALPLCVRIIAPDTQNVYRIPLSNHLHSSTRAALLLVPFAYTSHA